MDVNEYQETLRNTLEEAKAATKEAWDRMAESDLDANSGEFQELKAITLLKAGTVAGLMHALRLTGAEVEDWMPPIYDPGT